MTGLPILAGVLGLVRTSRQVSWNLISMVPVLFNDVEQFQTMFVWTHAICHPGCTLVDLTRTSLTGSTGNSPRLSTSNGASSSPLKVRPLPARTAPSSSHQGGDGLHRHWLTRRRHSRRSESGDVGTRLAGADIVDDQPGSKARPPTRRPHQSKNEVPVVPGELFDRCNRLLDGVHLLLPPFPCFCNSFWFCFSW